MAKRQTGVGRPQKTRSKKSPKRLAAKKEMLALRALKPAERKKRLAEKKRAQRT